MKPSHTDSSRIALNSIGPDSDGVVRTYRSKYRFGPAGETQLYRIFPIRLVALIIALSDKRQKETDLMYDFNVIRRMDRMDKALDLPMRS